MCILVQLSLSLFMCMGTCAIKNEAIHVCVNHKKFMKSDDGPEASKLEELYAESKLVELVRVAENYEGHIPEAIPLDKVRLRVQSLQNLRRSCLSDDGWKLQKESRGVRTLYRNHPSTSHIHSIRLDGDVESPVFILLALLHEIDLFHKWVPSYSLLGLNFARLISHPSPTELLVHLNFNVPWPFSNRYCFFHCDGIDCMDDANPQIGVIMNDLTNEGEHGVVDDSVKTTFHPPSGVLLTPLESGRTKVQVVVNVDPQIALMPDWLIDFAVRNLAFMIIVRIRTAAEIVKSDPEYRSRMTEKTTRFTTTSSGESTNRCPGKPHTFPPTDHRVHHRPTLIAYI